ncbi:MAG TPA: phosphodiester glycosidase family protein, partial [Acidimicrobiia bacterium]|nr:phosphodiester glycosidase family protein [Acidimicrobiia bacterium]
MRPSRRILLAAIVPLLAATAFGAQGSVPAGYQRQSSAQLAPGVDHESLSLADPAQSVHVARVAPGAARLVAVSNHDAVAHQGTGGELPSDMCRRVACFAGINADFHDAATGEPLGGVVSGGRLLRSPAPGRDQLTVTRDGRFQAGPLVWGGSVTASDGRTVPVGGVNVDPDPGAVVLYTPAWGGDTPDGADTDLIVRATGAVGAIGATTPLEIIGVSSDAVPIPADGAVLAASGSASATLHELADLAAAGRISRTISLRIRTDIDAVESVGGNPTVLRSGHPDFPDVDDSFTRARHPRALVGWNPSGEIVLVTVDAGYDGASGMTLAEAADLLTGLGATDGFGFDGGAATFVAGGDVQNLPTDDADPAPTEGREVAPGHMERPAVNALMVVPKLPDPPPAPPASGSGSGSGAKPGAGATTTTTAPLKLTVAGGGAAPATGGLVAPGAPAGNSGLPSSIDDILRNPNTRRPRRQSGKGAKGKRTKDGTDEAAAEPSIPDWNDINAALTPDAVAGADQPDELSLAAGSAGHH